MKRTALIRKTRLRPRSPRRAVQERTYSKLRRQFLAAHPFCQFPTCGRRSTDVHHRAGRVGALLLDVTRWSALCRPCHDYLTTHPAEAYALGLSERRVS